MTEKNHENLRQADLRLKPETSLIRFGVLYFIHMGLKIPITQEYDDATTSENKRLMR